MFRKDSEKDKKVLAALDEIEGEMRKIGFWMENPPSIKVGIYTEAPSFELWLQCVFLLNARRAVKAGEYPKSSQVGVSPI